RALGRPRPARVRVVPRPKPPRTVALRRVHGRLSRRSARRSRQREPRRRVDARVPARTARDARLGTRPRTDTDREDAMSAKYRALLHRCEKNPILTAADWPYPAHTVFNPGA